MLFYASFNIVGHADPPPLPPSNMMSFMDGPIQVRYNVSGQSDIVDRNGVAKAKVTTITNTIYNTNCIHSPMEGKGRKTVQLIVTFWLH